MKKHFTFVALSFLGFSVANADFNKSGKEVRIVKSDMIKPQNPTPYSKQAYLTDDQEHFYESEQTTFKIRFIAGREREQYLSSRGEALIIPSFVSYEMYALEETEQKQTPGSRQEAHRRLRSGKES